MSTSEHTGRSLTPPGDLDVPPRDPRTARGIARILSPSRLSGVYAWMVLVGIFAIWVPETFLTASTARSIASNSAVTAIVALALIVPLACEVFDLSVAATLGVTAVLSLHLQTEGQGVIVSVVACLVVGALVGAVNGVLVVRVGISSFIATLGTSSVLAALAFWITGGDQLVAPVPSTFVSVGQGTLLGVPNPVWCAVAVAAVLYYVTEWTTSGRYLYAVGGNAEASRLVGIRVGRITFLSLVTSGSLAALAGIVLSSQLGSSNADIGPAYLLPAFSAVLLGATQITTNGRVNVLGTLVAVLLLATGIYGLQLAGAPSYISNLFNGAALIVAVALSLRASTDA